VQAPQLTNLTSVGVPAALASTLDHIVGQLDIVTQCIGVLEQRLTMVENRISGGLPQKQ
jgi:centriolar protein POC1